MNCVFEAPSSIYYSFITVFLLSILTAFIILYRNKENPKNRSAFFFILMIAIWIIVDLAQWTTKNENFGIFLQKLTIFSATIHLFFLYFSYHIADTPISCKKKIIFALPLAIFIPWIFTSFGNGIIHPEKYVTCYFIKGPIIWYYYLLVLFYTFESFRILAKRHKEPIALYQLKSQLRVSMFAIVFLTAWIIFFKEIFHLGTSKLDAVEFSSFFITGIFFFITLIAFAIIKCDLFEFNTVPTKRFTISLWSVIFLSMLLFNISSVFVITYAIAYAILLLIFWKL